MVKSKVRIPVLTLVLIMLTTIFIGCKSTNGTIDKDNLSVESINLDVKDDADKEATVKESKKESNIASTVYNIDDGDSTLADVTYNFGQFQIGGGGFVTGLISCPNEKNLFFARTDVGGAYRWMEETKSWIALNYGISEADRGLLSVDGLAIDPSSPNKVYMVAGCDYSSNKKTAILISEDYGDTFTQVDVSSMIKVHGNGMGRQNGERIAVDPNKGNVILCGGRTGGLLKSTDSGKTWAKVSTMNVNTTPNYNGINSIVFDKETGETGKETPRIFVAVSRTSEENIYVSEDAGQTWSAVAGLPLDWMPQRMKLDADGNLLITYADTEGPWNCNTGGIYRYNPNTKEVQDISPSDGRPMGDIVTDPADANRMLCTTMNTWNAQVTGGYGDIFYTSTDGGKNWTNILGNMTLSANGCPWITTSAMHWCGSLLIDPFNSSRIFVTSGNGIFGCDNIWDDTKDFYFNAKGLEETVPIDLLSIPDGNIIIAIGDYGSFIFDDIHEYGTLVQSPNGTNLKLAYAANEKDNIVRVTKAEGTPIYLTKDAGLTWNELKGVPKLKLTEKPAFGFVAISPDASRIFWSPDNGSSTYYTDDEGVTWEECIGIHNKTYIICDPTDANYVYANNGIKFYVSKDGGKNFETKEISMNGNNRIGVVPNQAGLVFLPNGIHGLVYSTDYGENFTTIKSVKTCKAVGTGKAKNDKRPDVIYIWGSLSDSPDLIGLYASEDFGQTWTRINDEEHQFGGLDPNNGNFVVGDPNEYGRVYMSTGGLGTIYCEIRE